MVAGSEVIRMTYVDELNLYQSETIESLWLVLTYNCQLQCPWCYAHKGSTVVDFPLDKAVNACQFIQEIGGKNIILIGGEPLLYPNLLQIIQTSSKLNLNSILITNGFLLNQKRALSLKETGLSRVTISLKGCDVYGSYTTLQQITNPRIIQNAVEALKKYDLEFETSYVMDTKKLQHYVDLIAWARSHEIPTLLFLTYVPPAGDNSFFPNIPTPQETARLIELLYLFSHEFNDIQCQFVFQYPFCLFQKQILAQMIDDNVLYAAHGLLYTGRGFAIDPQGQILPSSHWVGYPLFHLNEICINDTISSKKFFEKWNSIQVLNFRKQLWHHVSTRCGSCAFWPTICVGGNPLVWQEWDESELLPEVIPDFNDFVFK